MSYHCIDCPGWYRSASIHMKQHGSVLVWINHFLSILIRSECQTPSVWRSCSARWEMCLALSSVDARSRTHAHAQLFGDVSHVLLLTNRHAPTDFRNSPSFQLPLICLSECVCLIVVLVRRVALTRCGRRFVTLRVEENFFSKCLDIFRPEKRNCPELTGVVWVSDRKQPPKSR